jgi:RNA polymerase sigma-70 factor (ECF subfamily)
MVDNHMLRSEAEDGAVALAPCEATTEAYEHLEVSRDRAQDPSPAEGFAQDARWVSAACDGDRYAMTMLHQRYAPMIHGILLARAPSREAEDLAQDVFVQAIVKLPSLRDPTRFAGWLAMIARNAATDHHRQKRANAELDHERHATSDGRHAERRVRALEVLDVIKTLPMAYREALVLRLVEGMTGPEIAERSGLTPGSVRVNLHRGMALLRQALREQEGAT